MKKSIIITAALLITAIQCFAQIAINPNNSLPDPSAGLDVQYSNKGVLIPRMTMAERDAIVNPANGLMIICIDCGEGGALNIYLNGTWKATSFSTSSLAAPVAGTHVPSATQIVWNWGAVTGATGYKWNTVNNYGTATDMLAATSKAETGLTCNVAYIRYVWAYNGYGPSLPTILTQSTVSCPFSCGQTLTDSRDGKNYSTVLIGAQCWMSKDLNVGTRIDITVPLSNNGIIEKYCYNNSESYCDVYGGMYNWNELMNYATASSSNPSYRQGICPTGWHLPSDAEMTQLASFLGGTSVAGGKMKETGTVHWASPNAGATNSSGFTSLPGGYASGNSFGHITINGNYWSTTESSTNVFYYFNLHYNHDDLVRLISGPEVVWSGRCLKDPCDLPSSPTPATHTPSQTQIIWNWNTVSGATGYKWNNTNNYNTATEIGANTSKTETGLSCNNSYSRYIWAYNGCGPSAFATLTQATTACNWTCGQPFTINHLAGYVAPVNKSVTYSTVTNIPGETTKCWITSNLGASQQASAVNDATEASAGWYWQFNRMQGYKHDGTNVTPAWTLTTISESSDWQIVNDPCSIEIGNMWRIPTYSEWYNVDNAGGWNEWTGPWNSTLKLHAAGHITSGTLSNRGSYGNYWSTTQSDLTNGNFLNFGSAYCQMNSYFKASGFSVRCIKNP